MLVCNILELINSDNPDSYQLPETEIKYLFRGTCYKKHTSQYSNVKCLLAPSESSPLVWGGDIQEYQQDNQEADRRSRSMLGRWQKRDGDLCFLKRDFKGALQNYETALQYFRESRDKLWLAGTLETVFSMMILIKEENSDSLHVLENGVSPNMTSLNKTLYSYQELPRLIEETMDLYDQIKPISANIVILVEAYLRAIRCSMMIKQNALAKQLTDRLWQAHVRSFTIPSPGRYLGFVQLVNFYADLACPHMMAKAAYSALESRSDLLDLVEQSRNPFFNGFNSEIDGISPMLLADASSLVPLVHATEVCLEPCIIMAMAGLRFSIHREIYVYNSDGSLALPVIPPVFQLTKQRRKCTVADPLLDDDEMNNIGYL
ncbi:hypothetical protein Ciccas_009294 [Cichlidogyrus casuarinus]|uniref:Trs120/TRAPPC9 N-terminal domain-containing protein n=1 Tax=Cichlidogyrus casuarinus TaxID=1844966 RepID=A0ABD2PXG9_9PLAT